LAAQPIAARCTAIGNIATVLPEIGVSNRITLVGKTSFNIVRHLEHCFCVSAILHVSFCSIPLRPTTNSTHRPMQFFDGPAPRDPVVVLAWAVATVLFKTNAVAERLLRRLPPAPQRTEPLPPNGAGEVRRLVHQAERSVWRCETLAALQADAHATITEAEEDYAALVRLCAAVSATPPPAEPAPEPAEPPSASPAAPLAA
jgi:hypothetical protein